MKEEMLKIINPKSLIYNLDLAGDNYLQAIRDEVSNKYLDIMEKCYTDLQDILSNYENKESVEIFNKYHVDLNSNYYSKIEDYLVCDEQGKIQIQGQNYKLDKNIFRLIHGVVEENITLLIRLYFKVLSRQKNYKQDVENYNYDFIDLKVRVAIIQALRTAHQKYGEKQKILYGINNYSDQFKAIDYPSRQDYINSAIDSAIFMSTINYLKSLKVVDEHGKSVS